MQHSVMGEEARAALRRHVLEPLAPRCVDREYGGFLVDFDERWKPVGPHDKTLEHVSRTTGAFALMARVLPGEGCEQLVRHGCAFLESALWDDRNGGFFVRVDRTGRPAWEGLKHPHAVTYAARAFLLAEPYLEPGEGRLWALRALAWLDDVAWDPIHGGYWGSFRRDNERYADGARLPTYDGRDVLGSTAGLKEVNTLGDAIEMLTEFVAQGVGEQCANRLAFLVNLVADRLTDPAGAVPYLYRRDWRPIAGLIRVGQQWQMVHRLLAAAAVSAAADVPATSRKQCDFCLASARHPSGGFCFAVAGDGRTWPDCGASSDLRYWWVQLEAAQALHALATHEATDGETRARYERALEEQWSFLRGEFFDTRYGGIRELPDESKSRWRAFLPERLRSGSVLRKTHGWKDPYHEVGTFVALGWTEGTKLKPDAAGQPRSTRAANSAPTGNPG